MEWKEIKERHYNKGDPTSGLAWITFVVPTTMGGAMYRVPVLDEPVCANSTLVVKCIFFLLKVRYIG